ncbi:hypothetical protein E6Q11_06365 [Candidatus Dojkabacteria bacterium]|uniref:Uncharacterized protein n=1 Tax=Candidatus Dojkabacteria bacterium TaxID=2099670 RepID=A0A5C7J2V7_9BACT|nr:MAG: hypothetical protein E6Q11_06365 [Candidatus Dojkabacteria bacterium]
MSAENKKTFNLPGGLDQREFQALVDEANDEAWREATKGTSLDNSPSVFAQELDEILLKGKGSEALPLADTALDNQEVLRGRRRGGAARRERVGRVERGKRADMKGTAQTVQTTPVSAAQEVAKQVADPYAEIVPGQAWQRQGSVNGKNVVEVISLLAIGSGGVPIIKRTLDGEDNLFAIHPNTIEELREELRQGQYQPDLSVNLSDKPEMPEQWTEERLLREVPQGEFILKNSQGTMRFYRRQGDEFLNRGGKGVPLTDVLDKLRSGRWKIEPATIQTESPASPDLLKGRDPKGYDDLRDGDIWVVRDANGRFVKGLRVNTTFGFSSTGDFVNAETHVQEVDGKLVFPENIDSAEAAEAIQSRDWPRAEFQQALRNDGYVLEVVGEQNTEARSRVELPPTDNQTEPSFETPKPELEGPLPLDKALKQAEGAVNVARDDFVRLEAEQKGAWLKLKNFFRGFAGSENEMSPEVSQKMEEYKRSLTQLLSLRVEAIKHSNLRGEALRQAIAGLVREFDFTEGEDLDKTRREARLGKNKAETLKEKWHKVLEGAKRSENIYTPKDSYSEVLVQKEWYDKWALLWGTAKLTGEVGVQGARALGTAAHQTGIQYNRLTDTEKKKVAMAVAGGTLAGVLVFSGGGAAAATAGLLLGLKRLGAAAGATVAVKGATDAWAQHRREQKTQTRTEDVLNELELTKADELKGFVNNPDLSNTNPTEATLTPEKIRELENWLKQFTIDNVGERGAQRHMGRLWRNTVAGVAGGALAWTAPGALAHAVDIAQESASTGAVERVAARLPGAASAASAAEAAGAPASAASMAEHGASAPAGGASAVAQAASAAEATLPVTGGPGTLPSGGPGVPTELPNALNQSPEFYRSGLPIDTAKLDGVLGERAVARGDTIWKYALESGKAAGFDEKGQARFAALLREKLVEKLSTIDPDVAKAAGFTPNADGVFTPDFIRAGDTLHLDKILTSNEMQELATQAQQATGATGEVVVTGKSDIFNTSYTSLAEAAKDAVKEYGTVPDLNKEYTNLVDAAKDAVRLYGEVGTQSLAPSPGAVQEVVSAAEVSPRDNLLQLMEEKGLNKNAASKALAEYLSDLTRSEQVKVFQGIRGTVRDLFDTPEISIYNNYDANYDLSVHPELAQASVARVLADHGALSDRAFYMYDRTVNPLHWTQMQQVARFNENAVKALGRDMAKPLLNEGVSDYTRRIAILAHAKGITFPGLRVIQ